MAQVTAGLMSLLLSAVMRKLSLIPFPPFALHISQNTFHLSCRKVDSILCFHAQTVKIALYFFDIENLCVLCRVLNVVYSIISGHHDLRANGVLLSFKITVLQHTYALLGCVMCLT